MQIENLISKYKELVDTASQKMAAIANVEEVPESVSAEISQILGEADVLKEQISMLEKLDSHKSFLVEPMTPSSAKWRISAPGEGDVEFSTQDWVDVDVKSFSLDPVYRVPREEKRTVRFYVPAKVQKKEYASSFEAYVRFGKQGLGATDAKTLSEGMDNAGGFLVPPDFQAQLIQKIAAKSTIRQNARVVVTSRDLAQWPKVNSSGDKYTSPMRISWTGETPSATSHRVNTSEMFGMYSIPVATAMASVPISNNFLEDSAFDVFGLVSDILAESFALGENEAFISGNGSSQPMGILTAIGSANSPSIVNSGSASTLTPDGLISLAYALPEQYESNAKWYFSKTTEAIIRKMKASDTSLYYWPVATQVGGFGATVPSLLGFPIVRESMMPEVEANSYPIIFGDLNGYIVLDRVGLSIQRLSELYAEQNMTLILGRRRVGGMLVEPWRVKVQKVAQ